MELQRRRADLLFLHSAAVEWQGGVCLLASESGGGKSTTTWALLHHGFKYLSDELSPVDPLTMKVFPYSHAICLKWSPHWPGYQLPADAVDLGRTIHVPTTSLPASTISGPIPVRAVFLLQYLPRLTAPSLHAISAAEACARMYVAEPVGTSESRLGRGCSNRGTGSLLALSTADLAATCALIRGALGPRILPPSGRGAPNRHYIRAFEAGPACDRQSRGKCGPFQWSEPRKGYVDVLCPLFCISGHLHERHGSDTHVQAQHERPNQPPNRDPVH